MIPPDHAKQGHEIKGVIPIWYEVPEHQHMKCNKSPCSDCLLLHIEVQFDELITELRDIHKVPWSDILVIVSCSALKKDTTGSTAKKLYSNETPSYQLQVKSSIRWL